MKKKMLTILVVLVVIGGIAGGICFHTMNLPQYALYQMITEVKNDGIDAIEPHLSAGMKQMYRAVSDIINNPWVRLAAGAALDTQLFSLLEQCSDLQYQLGDVKYGKNSADVTILVSGADYTGSVDVNMERKQGEWFIRDVSIPTAGWMF